MLRNCLYGIEHSEAWNPPDRPHDCEIPRYVGYRTDVGVLQTLSCGRGAVRL